MLLWKRYGNNKMAAILHLQQYSRRLNFFFLLIFQRRGCEFGSLDSVIGIATSYELYGPAFESQQGKSFFLLQSRPYRLCDPTQPSIQ